MFRIVVEGTYRYVSGNGAAVGLFEGEVFEIDSLPAGPKLRNGLLNARLRKKKPGYKRWQKFEVVDCRPIRKSDMKPAMPFEMVPEMSTEQLEYFAAYHGLGVKVSNYGSIDEARGAVSAGYENAQHLTVNRRSRLREQYMEMDVNLLRETLVTDYDVPQSDVRELSQGKLVDLMMVKLRQKEKEREAAMEAEYGVSAPAVDPGGSVEKPSESDPASEKPAAEKKGRGGKKSGSNSSSKEFSDKI